MSAGRRVSGCLAVLLVAASAACSASDSLHARSPRTVRPGQIVNASATASVVGRRVSLMVPSGRVDLVATNPLKSVPAESVAGAHPLQAAGGTALVGVSWILQRAAYPDSANRQLADPKDIFGEPEPMKLWLVTDGSRHEVPQVSDMTTTADRPTTAVWMSVPDGVRTYRFALEYGGVTQTVDARSGRVSAGVAAPLYRALPLPAHGVCDLGSRVLTSCLTDYAVGFPYVRTAGWAPPGKTWALLGVTLESNFDGARTVTVAGVKPRADVGDNVTPLAPFLVDSSARRLPVRGTVPADDLDRGTVAARLTATLIVPAS